VVRVPAKLMARQRAAARTRGKSDPDRCSGRRAGVGAGGRSAGRVHR
jgi:hypothetical protein